MHIGYDFDPNYAQWSRRVILCVRRKKEWKIIEDVGISHIVKGSEMMKLTMKWKNLTQVRVQIYTKKSQNFVSLNRSSFTSRVWEIYTLKYLLWCPARPVQPCNPTRASVSTSKLTSTIQLDRANLSTRSSNDFLET